MQPIINTILLLLFDISVSWIRMFIALGVSILIGLAIGIYVGRSERAEKVIIPIVDILQTLPILTFFPFVILVFVAGLPGTIGVNAAIIFLIITSMLWNIIFGVYTSIKTLPSEFLEVADLAQMGEFERLTKIFVPASLPSVAEQSMLSWAIGLFYLVTSEIFSTSTSFCSTKSCEAKYGIGVALTKLAFSGHILQYVLGIALFIAAVTATMILIFIPINKRAKRYKDSSSVSESRFTTMLKTFKRAFAFANTNHHLQQKQNKHIDKKIAKHKSTKVLILLTALIVLIVFISYLILSHSLAIFASYEYISLINLAASFARVWVAFLIILLVSIPVSIYLIFLSKKESIYLTLFEILASIPATILLPIIAIAVASFSLHNEILAMVIYFLSGIWYMIFSIVGNAKTLNLAEIMEVKNVFDVKGISSWKSIYVQAIMPGILTGAITAIAAEWNASIVAEYFTNTGITGNGNIVTSVGYGIGKLLDVSLSSGNTTLMVVALLNMVAMIIIINTFVWKKIYKKVESIR